MCQYSKVIGLDIFTVISDLFERETIKVKTFIVSQDWTGDNGRILWPRGLVYNLFFYSDNKKYDSLVQSAVMSGRRLKGRLGFVWLRKGNFCGSGNRKFSCKSINDDRWWSVCLSRYTRCKVYSSLICIKAQKIHTY